MVPTFRQAAARSNGYSTLERLLGRGGTLGHEATVEHRGPITSGLGQSVVFIRGLAQLKIKKSVEIGGLYAKHWPKYLEEKIGLKPVDKQKVPGSSWEWSLRDYQKGTERLNPWIDTKDGSWQNTFWLVQR
jgi:hypothetical protein